MDYHVLRQVATSVAIFIACTGAALVARHLVLSFLRRWSAKTETPLDDLILAVIRVPSIYWSLALGLYLAIGTSDLPARVISLAFSILHALVIMSFSLVAASVTFSPVAPAGR